MSTTTGTTGTRTTADPHGADEPLDWARWCARQTLVRVLLVAFVAVAGLPTLLSPGPPVRRAVELAVTVTACVVLDRVLHRPSSSRTDALSVALALLAAFAPTGTPGATLVTLLTAQSRPLRPALLVAGASVSAHLVLGWWRPVPGLSWPWWALIVVAVHAALVGWGRNARAHARLVTHLRARAEAAEAEQARRVVEARATERARIAREMHDVLAHRLSLLATWAGALEYRSDASSAEVAHAAGVVREGLHHALDEVRDVIGVLRTGTPAADDVLGNRPLPGAPDVVRLVDETRAAGQDVELVVGADLDAVPPTPGRTAYRVVQEGLTNARRHAAGRPVRVRIEGSPGDGLAVELVNDLADGAPRPGGAVGSGLVGLRERAELLDGRLEQGVHDGRFRLAAWVPWRT